MYLINSLLKQLDTAQDTHTASALIQPDGIANIGDAVHTNVHMVPTSVDASAFEELATRNAPMGTTWIIPNAGVDADKIHLAARVVIAMDTHTATVTTPNTLVITTTSQRAVTGAANTDIGVVIHDPGQTDMDFSTGLLLSFVHSYITLYHSCIFHRIW